MLKRLDCLILILLLMFRTLVVASFMGVGKWGGENGLVSVEVDHVEFE